MKNFTQKFIGLLALVFAMIFTANAQEALNMSLLSKVEYSNAPSDVWGYATVDGEYALLGLYDGISVVDVSNPALPNELEFFPGYESIWRDLKTWGDYLYCINESGAGLQIVNLSEVISGVPNPTYIENTSLGFTTAHNIFIDENGVLYVFGANYGAGGAAMYDLVSNPENPTFLGIFDAYYLHDGMVRGDTLWGGAIYNGVFSVVDVSDKANPVIIGSHPTPHSFTHNCWISEDGNTVYTTDEISGAFVTAYDVSDLNNIEELDRIQAWSSDTDVIPHNTHVMGNYLVTSYYTDGVSIVDASDPTNLQEVAYYDTSIDYSGGSFDGAWGAYPFLPSGNILVSDRQEGLHVLSLNIQTENIFENEENFSIDTLFYYDCANTLILPEENIEDFTINIEDFDQGVAAPYSGETDSDLLDYVSGFFWTYDRDNNSIPTEPNGDLTFDWDENTDPSVPDTAWYMTAYSWFEDPTTQADNWLGMGPVTIPDEGAEFKFHHRGISDWIDGFDLYVTTGGMEPYNDVDPGVTDITYSLEGHYPQESPQDTIWTQHSVSLDDFAGQSIYFTFHHHDTDMERLMLDNFLIFGPEVQECNDDDEFIASTFSDFGILSCSEFITQFTNYEEACSWGNIDFLPNDMILSDYCSCSCIEGCTNLDAINYDSNATINDGSCELICSDSEQLVTLNGGVWQEEIGWEMLDCDGNLYLEGGAPFNQCIELPENVIISMIDSFGDGWNGNILTIGEDIFELLDGSSGQGLIGICGTPGCTDSNSITYNVGATVNDGSCEYECPYTPSGLEVTETMCYSWVYSGDYTISEVIDWEMNHDCSCVEEPIYGCTDIYAENYNAQAQVNDSTCEYSYYEISNTYLGSSYNMYTVLSPSTNSVHANNDLGTISFTHRQNHDLPGGSGVVQTSYSTDGGGTWNYVLTHDTLTQVNRYPSGLLVDPSGAGAQAVVVGPSLLSGGWDGIFTNNIALDGSEGRENIILDSESAYPSFTRNSMMVDDNAVVRVSGYNNNGIDLVVTTGTYNADGQSTFTYQYATYVQYFAGGGFGSGSALAAGDTVWYMTSENHDMWFDGSVDSGYLNDVRIVNYEMLSDVHTAIDTVNLGWSNVAYHEDSLGSWNAVVSEADSFYVETAGLINTLEIAGDAGYYWTQKGFVTEGLVELYDWSMAFSNDGNTGYLVAQGTDANGQIIPFVHRSTDGGETWLQLSHDFSYIDGYISPRYNGGIDCAVDKYGDLHMISSVFEGDASITETNRKVYDIVVNQDGWSANYISDINTERVLDTDPMAIDGIGYNHRIQAARSQDGSKVFAVWTDVNIEEFGEIEKLEFPDIYAYGIDVDNGFNTLVKNFTKYTSIEGACYWMFTSPIALDVEGGYMLPTTRSEAGPTQYDPMEHYYVDGITFIESDFGTIGCTDILAENYIELAIIDDGSCEYISGCTDVNAANYNIDAIIDDGSCMSFYTYCNEVEIVEDFEGYQSIFLLAEQSELWTTWANSPGTEEDAPIMPDFSYSGENSLVLMQNIDGVTADMILPLGNHTSGIWELSFMMYVPETYGGYFNIMHEYIPGSWSTNWAFEVDFSSDGNVLLDDNIQFTYNHNVWFPVVITIDNDADLVSMLINEQEYTWQWSIGSAGESFSLGALDLSAYTSEGNGLYYVDDIMLNNLVCIGGCTNLEALNYNTEAIYDDATCIFTEFGCTDLLACNYNPIANINDGTCVFEDEIYDCYGDCINDVDQNGVCDEFQTACPYPEFIEYDSTAFFFDYDLCITPLVYGCTDSLAYNYYSVATVDDGSCEGCMDELAFNYSSQITIENNSYCEYLGCTNPISENYNSQANIDDGTCLIYGCTFDIYPNYNPQATIDDGSCSMGSTDIYGCMDPEALNYNVVATIDNGGCEYLMGCALPGNWEYETSGSNHTMMIPEGISIDINGQPLTIGSTIGVFYHNENGELQCAGYTSIIGETTFIAVMGDDSTTDEIDGLQAGEEFIWVVWDILSCEQYELNPSYSVGPSIFTANGLTYLDALEHYTCQQIEFPGGWFIYSSYIQAEDMDAQLVMSSIVDNLIILKDNDGNAYLPEWAFNGIGELDFHYGYQIKTNTSESLEICGLKMQPEDQPIALQSGWNMVSYLRETSAPADVVLADLTDNDNLAIVKDYNGNPYLPEWDFNGIGNMYPGQGYQLKIYEADTLIYLSNDEQYRISTSQVIENKVDYFAKATLTGNNMHIVIPQDAWDVIPEIGSEIGAYNSDGILVGSAKYSNPTTVLTLWGDDITTKTIDGLLIDEPLVFKVWDKEQISDYKIENWLVGSNTYQVDAINVAAAIEIEAFTQTTNLFNAIPNPSQTKTNISFFVAEAQRVNISVYNVVGELVEVLANSEYNPGTHQLEMQVSNIEAGSYLYTMRAGDFEKTKQLIILK